MNIEEAKNKLICIAEEEIGYLEKKTCSELDSDTGNAGDKNYTKYARDMANEKYFNGSKQSYAWCATFVSWCFVQAFGKKNALALQCQPDKDNCGAGCSSASGYYKKKGQFYNSPEIGDQIFFYTGGTTNIGHTGIVVGIESNNVITIEGNTSAGSSVIPNGGGVFKKKYAISNNKIYGYGRPDWSMLDDINTEKTKEEVEEKMKNCVVMAQSGNTVNMRTKPSSTSNVIASIHVGTIVRGERYDNDWHKIEYGGASGYMMSKFIDECQEDSSEEYVMIKLPKQLAIGLLAAIESSGV